MGETEGSASAADVDRILGEYFVRRELGSVEPEEELLGRYPHLRAPLERGLREQEWVDRCLAEVGSPARGKVLGDFRLLREIGRGGMGIVYEAQQISLRRSVALKVLPAHVTLDPRAVERFHREATIAAMLHHPGIVDIHAVGEADGAHFFAMEIVEGTPLDRVIERMRTEAFDTLRGKTVGDVVSIESLRSSVAKASDDGGKRPSGSSAWSKGYIETTVRLVIQVADALEFAHQSGVIHRDVKPSNIIIRRNGAAVLTDFGLAQRIGSVGLTQTGEFAGTVNYVSPEQAMAKRVRVDHRTDVFSLGVTLYEMLTLRRAFEGDTVQEVLSRILTRDPIDPAKLNPLLAPDLVTIVLKALEKDPARRYASMQTFAEDLRAFLEYRPIRARPTPTAVRVMRWVRREPARAALVAVLLVGVPLVIALGQRLLKQEAVLATAKIESDLEAAFLQLAETNLEPAEVAFAAVLRAQPRNAEALAGAALTRLGQNDAAGALALLEPELARAGHLPAIDWIRADALRACGKATEADELERGLSEPRDDLALYLAGWRELRRGIGSTNWSLATLASGAPISGRPGTWAATLLDVPENARPRDPSPSFRSALGLLSRAIALSKSPRALYHYARVFIAVRLPDPEAARQSAEAIERFWPGSARALAWAGVARLAYDLPAASETVQRAIAANPELPLAHYYLGEVRLRMGDLSGAIAALNAETALSPEHPGARNALGRALYLAGKFEASIAENRRAVAIDPRYVEAHVDLARALLEIGNFEAALGACREALALEPEFAAAHFVGSLARQRGRDLQGAIAGWRQFLERWPQDADARTNLGVALLETHQVEAAIGEHEHAVGLDPKDARKLHDLGFAYKEQAEHTQDPNWSHKALAAFERAIELDPRFSDPHHWAAEMLGGLGDLPAKRRALDRWTTARPDDAFAWNDLAWHCVDPNDLGVPLDVPTALRASARAVELRGEDPVILDTRAWALFRDGKLEEALVVAERAYAATPTEDPARAQIGANLERFTREHQAAQSR